MSNNAEWKQKLRGMQDAYKKAQLNPQSQQAGFVDKPDGKYHCLVASAEFATAASTGRPQINWGFTILEGELAGQSVYDYQGLEKGEDSWVWVFKRLKSFGFDVIQMEIDEVPDALDMIVNSRCEVILRLKTNPPREPGGQPFQNKYIDKVLNPVGSAPTEEHPDDDLNAPVAEASTGGCPFAIGERVNFSDAAAQVEGAGLVRAIDGDSITVLYNKHQYTVPWSTCSAA